MTGSAQKQDFVPELLGRSDYAIIGEIVEPRTKVLDLGCGEGELLQWLAEHKGVDARGVEISSVKVQRAIRRLVATTDVATDAVEPCVETLRVTQILDVPPCFHHRFLHDIIGHVGRHAVQMCQPQQTWTRLREDLLHVCEQGCVADSHIPLIYRRLIVRRIGCVSLLFNHIILPFLCTSHEKGAIPYAKTAVILDVMYIPTC